MAGRPSDPLLALLREAARKKGFNTAALARASKLERARLKHVLAGTEALTVDELISISGALELTPADMGGFTGAAEIDPAQEWPPEEEIIAHDPRRANEILEVDPLGNQASQIIKLGYMLGVDIFMVLDIELLEGSGVPPTVLQRFPSELPLKLDAAYHKHQQPEWLPAGFKALLGFDALYTCVIPWPAIKQVTLFPLPPSEEPDPDGEEEPDPEPRRSHLRLVR